MLRNDYMIAAIGLSQIKFHNYGKSSANYSYQKTLALLVPFFKFYRVLYVTVQCHPSIRLSIHPTSNTTF